jgi:LPS O-antigen subunit length determinant protein (WzzB/FepE family)
MVDDARDRLDQSPSAPTTTKKRRPWRARRILWLIGGVFLVFVVLFGFVVASFVCACH